MRPFSLVWALHLLVVHAVPRCFLGDLLAGFKRLTQGYRQAVTCGDRVARPAPSSGIDCQSRQIDGNTGRAQCVDAVTRQQFALIGVVL